MNTEELLEKLKHYLPVDEPFMDDYLQLVYCEGFTYACGPHVIVRIPGKYGVFRPSAVALYDGLKKASNSPASMAIPMNLSAIMYGVTKCPHCDPFGSAVVEYCHECEGDGLVYFENEHHDYEIECKSCKGEGRKIFQEPGQQIPTRHCDSCKSVGWTKANGEPFKPPGLFDIGPQVIQIKYAIMLAQDFGPVTFYSSSDRTHVPIPFSFEGGDGIIMPCVR